MQGTTTTLEPVLQIVHVSDLHFKDVGSTDGKLLHQEWSVFNRAFRRVVKKRNMWSWREGTQGHYFAAPEAFSDYLTSELIPQGPEWFVAQGEKRKPPTWLVDTGDLTAFGDVAAIKLGNSWLTRWAQELKADEVRSLTGNHDAWAGCHPAFCLWNPATLEAAQKALKALPQWISAAWLANPLVAKLPGGGEIQLYALESIYWDPLFNLRAVGYVTEESLTELAKQAGLRDPGTRRTLRIVGFHHPVTYPWSEDEVRFLGVNCLMRMLSDDSTAERLSNDRGVPDIGPLAHLILSGHTHGAWPTRLPDSVCDVRQDPLGSHQLQLVAGALLLKHAPRAPPSGTSTLIRPQAFSDTLIDRSRCRAQVLRFYYDEERPWELVMYRIPISTSSGSKYRQGKPSRTVLYMQAPA
jgi:hypothetical protein